MARNRYNVLLRKKKYYWFNKEKTEKKYEKKDPQTSKRKPIYNIYI